MSRFRRCKESRFVSESPDSHQPFEPPEDRAEQPLSRSGAHNVYLIRSDPIFASEPKSKGFSIRIRPLPEIGTRIKYRRAVADKLPSDSAVEAAGIVAGGRVGVAEGFGGEVVGIDRKPVFQIERGFEEEGVARIAGDLKGEVARPGPGGMADLRRMIYCDLRD